jgi:Txe/YoeB family toxin of Txe-Axe toxin-antitoxin module
LTISRDAGAQSHYKTTQNTTKKYKEYHKKNCPKPTDLTKREKNDKSKRARINASARLLYRVSYKEINITIIE